MYFKIIIPSLILHNLSVIIKRFSKWKLKGLSPLITNRIFLEMCCFIEVKFVKVVNAVFLNMSCTLILSEEIGPHSGDLYS